MPPLATCYLRPTTTSNLSALLLFLSRFIIQLTGKELKAPLQGELTGQELKVPPQGELTGQELQAALQGELTDQEVKAPLPDASNSLRAGGNSLKT